MICALASHYIKDPYILWFLFALFGLLGIFMLRPLILKNLNNIKTKTGMEEKYVGKTAKAVEEITKEKGVISIYDERWQARNIEDFTIETGSTVEITGYDNIILKVKKVNQ